MSDALKPLIGLAASRPLTRAEAEVAFGCLFAGDATPAQIGGLLMALRTRGETVDEYAAAASVMRGACNAVRAPAGAMDIVGTGGDGKGTLNISTATALVVAGAGVVVAKHGNRNLSSKSGAADALGELGINVMVGAEVVERCLSEAGIGFMMAPMHHPAMRHVGPVRAELGTRTIFNILGPLTNPAGADNQVLGVFHPDLVGIQARVLQRLGSTHVLVVNGGDGLDEITLNGPTFVAELKDGQVSEYTVKPEDFGLRSTSLDAVRVTDTAGAKAMLLGVLENRAGPARDIVQLNAGAAIYAAGLSGTLAGGVTQAAATLSSGAALAKLEQLKQFSNR